MTEAAERMVRRILIDVYGQTPSEATVRAVVENVVSVTPKFSQLSAPNTDTKK